MDYTEIKIVQTDRNQFPFAFIMESGGNYLNNNTVKESFIIPIFVVFFCLRGEILRSKYVGTCFLLSDKQYSFNSVEFFTQLLLNLALRHSICL